MHQKVSEMTLAINQYKEELDKNKADKEKLQLTLQKVNNYNQYCFVSIINYFVCYYILLI